MLRRRDGVEHRRVGLVAIGEGVDRVPGFERPASDLPDAAPERRQMVVLRRQLLQRRSPAMARGGRRPNRWALRRTRLIPSTMRRGRRKGANQARPIQAAAAATSRFRLQDMDGDDDGD